MEWFFLNTKVTEALATCCVPRGCGLLMAGTQGRLGTALFFLSFTGKCAGQEEPTHCLYSLSITAQSLEYLTAAFLGCCFTFVQSLGIFTEVLCKWKSFISSVFSAVCTESPLGFE